MSNQQQSDDDSSPGASWHSGPRGPDREGMVDDWLPDPDDWGAKTVHDLHDPARVAALKNFDELFPECAHHQPIIDDFLDQYMKNRTSVGGKARDQFTNVLMSMFGGAPEDDSGEMLREALAAGLEDED